MPKRHAWTPNDDGDCTKCNLPEANKVHKAPHVVIVDRYDLKGKETEVVGPFLNEFRAANYAEALKECTRTAITTEVKPLQEVA